MADAMGEEEVAKLLTENLEDEKAALRKIQTIGTRLAEDGAKAARVNPGRSAGAAAELPPFPLFSLGR